MLRISDLQFMRSARPQVAQIMQLADEDLIPIRLFAALRARSVRIISPLFDELGLR